MFLSRFVLTTYPLNLEGRTLAVAPVGRRKAVPLPRIIERIPYHNVQPPSTLMFSPMTCDEASLAK